MRSRVAIIGTGSIADEHARTLRAAGDRVDLVAAADVDPVRLKDFCARHEITGQYQDANHLLEAERPDLIHVCTPPGTHAGLALRGLEVGAWVFCEKPLCGSLADLDRIEAAERATGCFCVSVAQWRFGSAVIHLKRLIDSGLGGRTLLGLCQTSWYRGPAYYSVEWRGRWDTALGGATVAQGIHAIDLFLWVMGGWQEVVATVATLDHETEVEDVSLAIVRFDSGALGSVVNSVASPHEETRLRFDLQRATFEVACLYQYSNRDWSCTAAPGAADVAAAWARIDRDIASSHAAQLDTVLDALEAGDRPPASARDMRPTLEFISGLYKSAATGSPVAQGSILPGDPFYRHLAGTLAR